jgi:hypothetical protein
MSRSNLRTPWPIHFKFHSVIGIDGRRQHSYNICKDFLSHNSGIKYLNFTKKYTDHKTINSNNYAKFEVNWPRGSQFTGGGGVCGG